MTLDDLLSTASQIFRDNGVPAATIQKAAQQIRKEVEAEKADKPKARKTTYQTVVLVPVPALHPTDGNPVAPEAALVIQMEDAVPASAALDRITAAALSFNRSKAGRRKPVATIGEVFEVVKGKHWVDESKPESKTRVVTRSMAHVLTYTNALKLT